MNNPSRSYHPFTAPCVRPAIKYFWKYANTTSRGIVTRQRPAAYGPHWTPISVLKFSNPTGSVLSATDEEVTISLAYGKVILMETRDRASQ